MPIIDDFGAFSEVEKIQILHSQDYINIYGCYFISHGSIDSEGWWVLCSLPGTGSDMEQLLIDLLAKHLY